MGGIDLPFHDLRPVARQVDLHDRDLGLRRRSPGRWLELRHQLLRPHIDPDESAGFFSRIGLVLDLLGEAAFGRLRDHLQHLAVHVELPAVVEAAQTAFLVAPEEQRGLAVRAELAEHADTPVGVAEGDEILAEEPDANRRTIALDQLLREQRRYPMSPHQPAHGGVAFDAAEQFVLFTGEHAHPSQTAARASQRQIT